MIARLAVAALVAAWTMLAGGPAPAADRLVVTSGHQGGWDALVANFGLRKGFFKEAGLEVEIVDMDTGAPTVQAPYLVNVTPKPR